MDILYQPESEKSIPGVSTNNSQGLLQWVSSVDHKQIGLLYLFVSLFFLVLGGMAALLMRVQLAVPENTFLQPEIYNQLFTMHGTTMIFLVLTPAILGFSVYFTPLMIGANDLSFPRLNALGVWSAFFGGLLLYFSFLAGGAPDAGWFNYAPLNQRQYSPGPGIDYYCAGLLLVGIGTVATAINLIVTIICKRVSGMSFRILPVFIWMVFINSFLIIGAFPPLNAALGMLLLDRQLQTHFFNAVSGGSPVVWQHLFWSFGHPEVYILILPPFGMLSEVFQVFSRKPIFGYAFMIASGIAIALLAFGVWVHHMFVTGLGNTVYSFFAATSMLIGVPTGVKIFNWIGTLWGGSLKITTAMLFAMAFLIEFTIGGLSGVSFAIVPIDWQLTDSYYVVAHLHYVFVGGSLFGIFAGLFYWFPKMSGRLINERAGKRFFWMFVIGFNLTFFIQHALGALGMPRRVYTYPSHLAGYNWMNMLSTAGAFLMGFSVLYLLYVLYRTVKRGKPAGVNPWNAYTLEWLTASPPPLKNFVKLPQVKSLWPLADITERQERKTSGTLTAPPASPEMQINPEHKIMVKLVVATEAVLFLSLIITYLYYDNHSGFASRGQQLLDIKTTALFSAFLFFSSFTYHQAEKSCRHKNGRTLTLWLGLTFCLGALFLLGQLKEYHRLVSDGLSLNSNIFSTNFFALTGLHGLHVAMGLTVIFILLILRLTGNFKSQKPRISIIQAAGIYWHFVDIVWLLVFTLVYVLPLLKLL